MCVLSCHIVFIFPEPPCSSSCSLSFHLSSVHHNFIYFHLLFLRLMLSSVLSRSCFPSTLAALCLPSICPFILVVSADLLLFRPTCQDHRGQFSTTRQRLSSSCVRRPPPLRGGCACVCEGCSLMRTKGASGRPAASRGSQAADQSVSHSDAAGHCPIRRKCTPERRVRQMEKRFKCVWSSCPLRTFTLPV